jgi:hypothetical protein
VTTFCLTALDKYVWPQSSATTKHDRSCFLWQLGRFGPILQNFLFDIQLASPLTFTATKPNTTSMSSVLQTYALTKPKRQKESSTSPITIGKLHNHASSTVTRILPQPPTITTLQQLRLTLTKAFALSVMIFVNFMTTLFPLHPRTFLILPILVNR